MPKNEIAKTGKRSAIQMLADRLNVSESVMQTTLKATAFRDCKTNEEFVAAVVVANTYGLNPLLKEIYVFSSQKGVVPIVPIDGWAKIVNREANFDGCELKENEDNDGNCISVTATFYLKHRSHPVVITEYMDECKKKGGTVWEKWPRRMLRHKAYIQGARLAFGFSGIYDEDEGRRIVEAEQVDGSSKSNVSMPEAVSDIPEFPADEQPAPTEPEDVSPAPQPSTEPVINDKQRKRLWAISNTAKWSDADVKTYLSEYGIDSTTKILRSDYEAIWKHIEGNPAQ